MRPAVEQRDRVTDTELLRPGDTGEAVEDLQARLCALGLLARVSGEFDDRTGDAVQTFQLSRGLRATGVCERETWSALLEAGYRLGDRLLYQRRPMLRGDDVTTLQQRLNALGFDAGREDGIFGPDTERALRDFQLNAGMASDGVLGPESRAALERLGSLAAGSVASVREREALRHGHRRIAGCRVFIGAEPGLDVLADSVGHGLGAAGAHVIVDHSGRADIEIAAAANDFEADVFLGLRTAPPDEPRCTFFANQAFRSEAGRAVALRIDAALTTLLGRGSSPAGRTYDLLRGTRMAAVVCSPVIQGDVESMRRLVANAGMIAEAIVEGVRLGVEEPLVDS